MEAEERKISFNIPQLLVIMSRKKEFYLEGGRGLGKSTIIAKRMIDVVNNLPRSKYAMIGQTYQQLLTRTLPSTIEGLSMLGYKKDLHYFVGRRPPLNWKWLEAHQPPLTYDNYISFYNGTGFPLISLDNADSGRGLNLDGCIGDEAALFDKDRLDTSVIKSIRGNIHRYSSWLHQSMLFATTTPLTQTGRWFTRMEEEARRTPEKIQYLIAPSTYNAHVLGAEYFAKQRRMSTKLIYDAEIMCIRPGKAQTGFYPAFDENHHTYMASNDDYVLGHINDLSRLKGIVPDADINLNAPIDIACDYGAVINTLVSGQLHGLVYKVLKGMHVNTPDTIKELAQQCCDYYSFMLKKEVNYFYDQTAIATNANRSCYADELVKVFESNSWTVNRIYVGQAPEHRTKYLFFDGVFKEQDINMPVLRLNKENCKYMILSLQKAEAKEGRKGIEKDKVDERNKTMDQRETTHYSDAFDQLIYYRFRYGLNGSGWYG